MSKELKQDKQEQQEKTQNIAIELNKVEQKKQDKLEQQKIKSRIKEIKKIKRNKKIEAKKKLNEEILKLQEEIEAKISEINEKKEKKLSSITNEKELKEIEAKYIKMATTIREKVESDIKIMKFKHKQMYSKGIWQNDEKKVIQAKNIFKYYITPGNITPVLEGLNLEIEKGELVAILGPSGSGKTTLLNLISGLDTCQDGDLIVANQNLSYLSDSALTRFRAANVSFIFQSYNLLPTLNVLENVKTGSQLQKDKTKRLNEVELLQKLGLYEERYKYPYQLSGGQQQRVAIARALAKNPTILFGDEPTGALDIETSISVLDALVKINKEFKTTLIIVTHEPTIAKICNKVIRMKNGNIDRIEINKKSIKPKQLKWE